MRKPVRYCGQTVNFITTNFRQYCWNSSGRQTRTKFNMAKKAAKVADASETKQPTKKAAPKKATAAAKPVKAAAVKVEASVDELLAAAVKPKAKKAPAKKAPAAKAKAVAAPVIETPAPAPEPAPAKPAVKKKAPAKKAAAPEMPELFDTSKVESVKAPAKAETPAKPKAAAAKKKPVKAVKAEPVAEAKAPEPAPVAPAPEPAPPGPAPVLPPASVLPPSSVPQQGGGKPRPLYIPRDVEAFLRAAGIPIPTEKPQLDAIMAAMSAAKIAAQQATGGRQQQQPRPPQQQQPQQGNQQQQPQNPQQGGQGGQQGNQQNQPRPSREERRQQHMQMRQQQRDQRRQQNQQNQNNQGGQQQPQGGQGDQSQPQQGQQQPRPPKVEEPVELVEAEGYCEISGKGFGFIRDAKRHFQPNPMDVFVTPEVVKRFGVKDGHWLKVEAKKNSRGMQINKLLEVNGQPPENVKMWPSFEDLTTISPIEHIKLETVTDRATTRIIDLLTPIGKGQRGLIVAPPRTGKTTLLNHIADAVVKNHPDMHLMILLVDERPEEVTDFRRNVPQAELWASSNDMDVKSHTRIATLAIERARRLVESGNDVFLLLDSITRLGRAFNNAMAGGGRTMSGGVDSRALESPRKFFASARNTEEAGSLTIVATALIDTGSRMDDLIFQEFKGTGNSEIVLDRKISDMRIYPAIDIFQSGTRREELILPADQLNKINVIRRGLAGHKPIEAIERVLSFVKRFPTNAALLREIPG
jgi:transcription termination factor Rho